MNTSMINTPNGGDCGDADGITGRSGGMSEPAPRSSEPAGEQWIGAPSMPGPASAERQRLATALLPLLPGHADEPKSTTLFADRLGLNQGQDGRLLRTCLDRLARGGLLDRTHRGRHCYWRATPLLVPLLHALPDPTSHPLPADQLAQRLKVPATELAEALAALAWCRLAEHAGSGRHPARLSWRHRWPAAGDDMHGSGLWAGPITVVTLIGSSQPGSRTLHLAEAALDALVTTGTVHPRQQHMIDLSTIRLADGRTPNASSRKASHRWPAIAQEADLLIAATPTYLGTYSGLLKLFLDRLGPHTLTRTVAVVAAVETLDFHCTTATALTSVLDHLGAHLPASPLILPGPGDPNRVAARWATTHSDAIRRALAAHLTAEPSAAPQRLQPAQSRPVPAPPGHPPSLSSAPRPLPGPTHAPAPHTTSILATGQTT